VMSIGLKERMILNDRYHLPKSSSTNQAPGTFLQHGEMRQREIEIHWKDGQSHPSQRPVRLMAVSSSLISTINSSDLVAMNGELRRTIIR